MSAPTPRHGHQLAAAKLASLLTLPAPECWTWAIGRPGDSTLISGTLAGADDIDTIRLALHQWAAVLDAPVWNLRAYSGQEPAGKLSVTGTYQGQRFEIWDQVDTTGLILEELSAPPQVDAPAAGPQPQTCERCGLADEGHLVPGIRLCRPCEEDSSLAADERAAYEDQVRARAETLNPEAVCTCDGSDPCPVHSWPVVDTVELAEREAGALGG